MKYATSLYCLLNTFKRPLLVMSLTVFISSCEKFVDVEPPKTQLVAKNVFSNNATANTALTSIYSQMENRDIQSYKMALLTGLCSDELINYSTYQDLVSFYENELNSRTGFVQDIWASAYSYIFQANSILEGVQSSSGLSSEVKSQLIGEAKFIRAFWHFYLVNLFGDIPLITTTDYKVNSSETRSPTVKVYLQIINDLEDAKQLLNSNFVDIDGVTPSIERVRVTKWAASSLLARVYLYTGDYVNAEKDASAVIDNSALFNLEPDLNNVFLKNSTETIWQLQPSVPGFNTPDGQNFILLGPPESGTIRCTVLSDHLLKAFEADDKRKMSWTSNDNGNYFPFKYKVSSENSITEYTMVLRLAEQYLIRAEARAQQNHIIEAQADLNVIRSRAGLPNSTSNDKASLLLTIEHERQVELFGEWGHRWMDIKRTNRANVIMPTISSQKGGSWNNNKQLFPIPQNERNNNLHLTQNAGY